ncbi:MAG: metal-dependent transcriptional regulator [Candidatus Brocadiia bacterium]
MDTRKRKATGCEEDYLEAILLLEDETGCARVNDLAHKIGVGKSAASLAVKALIAGHYVEHDSYGLIYLTEEGRRVAKAVRRNHCIFRDFLQARLLLPLEAADQNACRIEHVVSQDVIGRLVKYIEFTEACRLGGLKFNGRDFECPKKDTGECDVPLG